MHQHHNPDTSWSCVQVRDELEAWSLGALDPAETAAVDRHLAACAACREESFAWRGISGLLPFSLTPVSPSAQAKHTLMTRISEDQMAASEPSESSRLTAPPPSAPQATPGPQRRFHWSQLLVAPLVIALVVVTVWSMQLQDELDSVEGNRIEMLSSLAPDGVKAFQLQSSDCDQCDTAGRFLADPEHAEALMVAWNLDPGEVHEVWCEEGDGARTLVANLQTNDTGEVVQSLSFDQPISGYKRIFVLSEDGEVVEIRMSDLLGDSATPSSLPTDVQ